MLHQHRTGVCVGMKEKQTWMHKVSPCKLTATFQKMTSQYSLS